MQFGLFLKLKLIRWVSYFRSFCNHYTNKSKLLYNCFAIIASELCLRLFHVSQLFWNYFEKKNVTRTVYWILQICQKYFKTVSQLFQNGFATVSHLFYCSVIIFTTISQLLCKLCGNYYQYISQLFYITILQLFYNCFTVTSQLFRNCFKNFFQTIFTAMFKLLYNCFSNRIKCKITVSHILCNFNAIVLQLYRNYYKAVSLFHKQCPN